MIEFCVDISGLQKQGIMFKQVFNVLVTPSDVETTLENKNYENIMQVYMQ